MSLFVYTCGLQSTILTVSFCLLVTCPTARIQTKRLHGVEKACDEDEDNRRLLRMYCTECKISDCTKYIATLTIKGVQSSVNINLFHRRQLVWQCSPERNRNIFLQGTLVYTEVEITCLQNNGMSDCFMQDLLTTAQDKPKFSSSQSTHFPLTVSTSLRPGTS